MYNDLRIIVNNKRIDYIIDITKDKLIIKCNDINSDKLKIYYDNNIYKLIIKAKSYESDTINIDLTKEEQKEFIFIVELKDNYLVKTVYKYINELIDKDKLIEEINLFKKYNNKYTNDLNNLINKLNNSEEIENLILNNQNEYIRITNILINDDTYKKTVKKMTTHELMLLITWYISMTKIPNIDQDLFNDLVNDAINSDNSLENVWRLAMNYDEHGFNYNIVDEFFINSKDAYYLSEYICGVIQVNQEKIVNMLIESKDKELITEFLNKYIVTSNLEDKYVNMLKEYISR